MTFGPFIKLIRSRQELPLRLFCEEHGYDPGNYSKMERGLRPPPSNPLARRQLALNLDLREESEEWRQFFDLADIETGQIPKDILSDEELAANLPLVFRTLRGEKLTKEQLEEIAEIIRRE